MKIPREVLTQRTVTYFARNINFNSTISYPCYHYAIQPLKIELENATSFEQASPSTLQTVSNHPVYFEIESRPFQSGYNIRIESVLMATLEEEGG